MTDITTSTTATSTTKPKRKPAAKRQIVGVKQLEAEFGLTGKVIRRHLRKMEENTKPRGPEPYQWWSTDPVFKQIRKNLQAVVDRQPRLQAAQKKK
jgi:hypothetical protein